MDCYADLFENCGFTMKMWMGENDDTLLISQFGASNFWTNLNSWKTRYSVHYLSDIPILGHFWLVAAEGSMILLVWFRIMRSFVKRTFCLPRFKCLWDAISAIIVFSFVIRSPLFKPFFAAAQGFFIRLGSTHDRSIDEDVSLSHLGYK